MPLSNRHLIALAPAALAWCLGIGTAQRTPESNQEASRAIAHSLLHWVYTFEKGRIQLRGSVGLTKSSKQRYMRLAIDSGAVEAPRAHRERRKLTHLTMLQRLVMAAEKHPSPAIAKALLAVAASGYASDMFNPNRRMVQDQGRFALLRIGDNSVWHYVLRVAEGAVKFEPADDTEPAVELEAAEPRFDGEIHATWIVAAVRLLGMRKNPVFRAPLEACLLRPDSRVRLAAAEALGFLRHRNSLSVLTRALRSESNAMVIHALLESVHLVLIKNADRLTDEQMALSVRTAVRRLGRGSWRNDVAVVRLVRNFPVKEAVPRLIRLMRQARGEVDPILKIINKNASQFLGLEVYRALRKITGALIDDDPDKWQAFWEREKETLIVAPHHKVSKNQTVAVGPKTPRKTFYGIPVLGSEVIFVIDTSGSMRAAPNGKKTAAPRSKRRGKKQAAAPNRLDAAREQTLRAVQGMPKRARFNIVTFSSDARAWNRRPILATKSTHKTLAYVLGRLKPGGGTNLYAALDLVLESRKVGYGAGATGNVDEVFVMSDGQPNLSGFATTADMLDAVREINKWRKVRINTVFTGSGQETGQDFLRKLAEQNGGVFVKR